MSKQIGPALAALALAALATAVAPFPAQAYMAYVSNEKGNSITIIDTATLAVVKTIKVGQRPRGIGVSKDGAQIFVCLGDDDTIRVINAKTLELDGDLPSGPDPELLIVSPDGKTVYLSNENDNLVTGIDIQSRKVVAEIPVGVEPEGKSPSASSVLALMTRMVSSSPRQTNTCVPSLLTAMPRGRWPTLMVLTTASVAVSIMVMLLPFSFDT